VIIGATETVVKVYISSVVYSPSSTITVQVYSVDPWRSLTGIEYTPFGFKFPLPDPISGSVVTV